MPKNNQRDPNLRAATVTRVNQLVKTGLTKAGAFEKISAETGRAKDAVQMLYYRAIRANKGSKSAPKGATPKASAPKAPTSAAAESSATGPTRRGRSRKAARTTAPRAQRTAQSGDFPALLNGIATAINNLLKHVEKTVEENKTLKSQAQRLQAIASLIRGR